MTIALLKGRANYVCHYHLERNARDGRFQSPQDAADLRAIARFAQLTQSGDKLNAPTCAGLHGLGRGNVDA